jgi:hypothetical protein
MNELLKSLTEAEPFFCQDIKKVLKEKDALLKSI